MIKKYYTHYLTKKGSSGSAILYNEKIDVFKCSDVMETIKKIEEKKFKNEITELRHQLFDIRRNMEDKKNDDLVPLKLLQIENRLSKIEINFEKIFDFE